MSEADIYYQKGWNDCLKWVIKYLQNNCPKQDSEPKNDNLQGKSTAQNKDSYNKMKQGKFTIDIQISERDLIENLLNMKYSGVADEPLLLTLSLVALGEQWHYNKLIYYLNLLEIGK